MHQAKDMLARAPANSGKQVVPEWSVGSNKGHRTVNVANVVAFEQLPGETEGVFKEPFLHLRLK